MRDGIFKSLDMGRRWKSLMDHCGREADRGERSEQRAGTALRMDMAAELSVPFRTLLKNHVVQNQNWIPGFGSELIAWGESASCSAGERIVQEHVSRLCEGGMSGREAVQTGLRLALNEWNARRMRQVEQRLETKDRKAARPAIAEARRCLDSAAPRIAAEILGIESRPRRTRQPRIDMDGEDLSARR